MVQLDSKYYVNFKLRGIPEQTSVPRPVRKYLSTYFTSIRLELFRFHMHCLRYTSVFGLIFIVD